MDYQTKIFAMEPLSQADLIWPDSPFKRVVPLLKPGQLQNWSFITLFGQNRQLQAHHSHAWGEGRK